LKVRAFVGLELADDTRAAFARLRQKLERTAPPGVRLTTVEAMHVTLKFLGSIDEELVPPLAAEIEPHAARLPHSARVTGLGAFPRASQARILIAKLADEEGTLAAVAGSLDEIAERRGIAREARAFRPHLTLGRSKEAIDARPWLRSVTTLEEQADFAALVVYRSDASAEGSRYTSLARWPI
jgi:2'-5' RNA ligase